jgi:hypothetical protein
VELTRDAVSALETIRRTGRNVRFEIRKACEQERWRLKVVYEATDPATGEEHTVQMGLLWSEDRAALLALCERLTARRACGT